MISSGRCHGPGCRETADADFCSPTCETRWNAELAGYQDAMGRAITIVAARTGVDPKVLGGSGAAKPQVAPDSTRGWLSKLIDRWTGRTP